MTLELLQMQKQAELNNSITFCLNKPECKPFLQFLLVSTMAMDSIPAGLDDRSLIELATIHRVGSKILKVLMEVDANATGLLLTNIAKEEQNERAIVREQ